jgi:Flp pilus assembly pilin Flp
LTCAALEGLRAWTFKGRFSYGYNGPGPWHLCAIGCKGHGWYHALFFETGGFWFAGQALRAQLERSQQGCQVRNPVSRFFQHLLIDQSGQDIAEYAIMAAVILVIVVGTIRLIGSNANNVFSSVSSSIQ